MDELTTVRVLADYIVPPTDDAINRGRGALEQRIADAALRSAATSAPNQNEQSTARGGAPSMHPVRPTGGREARRREGHPVRNTFLALGGIAAAVLVTTVLLTNSLGLASWQSNGVGAPSSSTASAQASAPTSFTLPTKCADVVGTSILPQWSPRFGQADEVTQLSRDYSDPRTGPVGLHCVYGSNEDNRILSLDVRALDSDPGAREDAEDQARSDGLSGAYDVTEEPAGDGDLFVTTRRGDYVEVSVTLVTDKGVVSVAALGTEQRPAELLPYLRAWLDDLVTRTEANS